MTLHPSVELLQLRLRYWRETHRYERKGSVVVEKFELYYENTTYFFLFFFFF